MIGTGDNGGTQAEERPNEASITSNPVPAVHLYLCLWLVDHVLYVLPSRVSYVLPFSHCFSNVWQQGQQKKPSLLCQVSSQ